MSAGSPTALIAACPALNGFLYSPTCNSGFSSGACSAVYVSMVFMLRSFIAFDDTKETMSATGTIQLKWSVTCPTKLTKTTADPTLISLDKASLWSPGIHHLNAGDNYNMDSKFMSVFTASLSSVSDPSTSVAFSRRLTGVFVSTCHDLDYSDYPFDFQSCTIELGMEDSILAVLLQNVSLVIGDGFLQPGVSWAFLGADMAIGNVSVMNEVRSTAVITLSFRRIPEATLFSVIAPCAILASLEIPAFAMDGYEPDRPAFMLSVMLALSVFQDQINQIVPAKANRTFIINYTDCMSFFAAACTVYGLVSCGLARWRKQWFKDKIDLQLFSLTRSRVMDVCAFPVALVFYFAINLTIVPFAKYI